MARADVFIDASNFTIACRQLINGLVDVKAFARLLAKKSNHALGEVFFYDSPSPTPSVQQAKQQFWEGLKEAKVNLRKGRIEPNHDGTHREKECDVMLAVDMVVRACARDFDRAILVSGDTDLAYALETVKALELEVGWACLPTQHHVDRLRQVVPVANQIQLTEKILRPIRSQHRVRW